MAYYDRYKYFTNEDNLKIIPFCAIPMSSTDIVITFDKSTMRMDTLSYRYYNDPNYGWLILQANPELPSMEFSIEDGVKMRIPYPLSSAIQRYEKAIQNEFVLNDNA